MTDEMETTPAVDNKGPFHLELHAWIESQQTSHGVRHEDYAQYQKYCTNRLKRLSHHPDVKRYLVCSSKYAAKATSTPGGNKSRPRHAYASRKTELLEAFAGDNDASEGVPHENILWYFLVLSERAWACAKGRRHQTTQAEGSTKRTQVLKKYKKARDWAQILVDVAKGSTDDATPQECEAYLAWMKGNYALEKLDYASAIQEFASAMSLCHTLSQTSSGEEPQDDTKQLERQDLFLARADTVLRPLFRYCHYELKQAGESIPVEEPQGPSTTAAPAQGEDEIAVTFRGHDLVLDNKELRVLLLKLQSLQAATTSSNDTSSSEKSFLEILSVLDDSTDVVNSALQGYAQAVGPSIQAKKNALLAWKGYLQYQKTQRVMDHTQALLEDISGHAERVHVYDALLQHANSLLSLPKADEDDDDEDEFALQVQANCLRLRALKCYHMGWYYYSQVQKHGAALGLLQQAAKLSKRAQEEIAACDDDMPHADEYVEELEALPISSAMAAVKAAVFLQKGAVGGASSAAAAATTKSTDRPLLLRLDEADAGTVMAEVLPMPMVCKPVFFDIAYDYAMDTTESVERVRAFVEEHTAQPEEEEKEETTASGGGGLLGWLTG
mmetsp:Transcript_41145/g.63392  ORF Transcript_41145/g.63392 Transcript_41145/m.63392 type:complete len:612 (+) Transcript_41145:140-1975(+)